MAFGFDPSLIGPKRAAPEQMDIGGSLQAGMSLGDLIHRRQREASLADVLRSNGGNMETLAANLMQRGFGPEAFAAQEHQTKMMNREADLAQQRAQAAKILQEQELQAKKFIGGLFYGADTPEKYAAAYAQLPKQFRGAIPEQFDPMVATSLGNMAFSPEDRARLDHQKQELADLNKYRQGMLNRPQAPVFMPGPGGVVYQMPTGGGGVAQPVPTAGGGPMVKPPEGGGEKQLPTTSLTELADFDTAQEQVAEIFAKARTENISGLGARANQYVTDALGLQNTDAARFEGAAAPVRQGVGTILEGGKLAAGDEGKYKNMLPKYGDSPEVLDEKEKSLTKYLASLKEKRIKALKGGKYTVPGVKRQGVSRVDLSGKVTVSNGRETLEIDASDAAAAKKDGYEVVP